MKKLNKLMLMGALFFSVAANATPLYTKCVACHGEQGEKAALGKSKIIKDMSKDEFASSLIGYKNDTYGGAMKGIMKAQVTMLSDEQIQEITNYIVQK